MKQKRKAKNDEQFPLLDKIDETIGSNNEETDEAPISILDEILWNL